MANYCETDYKFVGSREVLEEILKAYWSEEFQNCLVHCYAELSSKHITKVDDTYCLAFWTVTKWSPQHKALLDVLKAKGITDYAYSYFAFEPGSHIVLDFNNCYTGSKYKVDFGDNYEPVNTKAEVLKIVTDGVADLIDDGTLSQAVIKEKGFDKAKNLFEFIDYLWNELDVDDLFVYKIRHTNKDIYLKGEC